MKKPAISPGLTQWKEREGHTGDLQAKPFVSVYELWVSIDAARRGTVGMVSGGGGEHPFRVWQSWTKWTCRENSVRIDLVKSR